MDADTAGLDDGVFQCGRRQVFEADGLDEGTVEGTQFLLLFADGEDVGEDVGRVQRERVVLVLGRDALFRVRVTERLAVGLVLTAQREADVDQVVQRVDLVGDGQATVASWLLFLLDAEQAGEDRNAAAVIVTARAFTFGADVDRTHCLGGRGWGGGGFQGLRIHVHLYFLQVV